MGRVGVGSLERRLGRRLRTPSNSIDGGRLGEGCWGTWEGGACRWYPRCLSHWGNVHVAAEGAQVTLVAAHRIARQVALLWLVMGNDAGGVVANAALRHSASSYSCEGRDGRLRSWRRVPRLLVQAQVQLVWAGPMMWRVCSLMGVGFGVWVSHDRRGSRHCRECQHCPRTR